jgi:penicillin-binding protein 1A
MAPRPARPKSSPSRGRAFLIGLLKIGGLAAFVVTLVVVVAVAIAMASLPTFRDMMRSPNGQSVQLRAADGSVLMALGPSYGDWLAYNEIPDVMVDAMIAVEDRRFYYHPGIDPIGTGRALYRNVTTGSMEGGSTITQQLARNIFLTSSQTYGRKVREAILALAIERRFSKQQILELYLNRVYFGGGAYGIDAASRKFFGHGANRLSLEEAAIIAGLVKAPSRYAPSSDPMKAKRRAATVIAVMQDAGRISAGEAAAADLETLAFAPQPRQNNVRYFTDWILGDLEALTDETVEPLIVTTTLMPSMQRAADTAIRTQTPGGVQGALVAMSTDGAVRAMMGGRDYVSSIYNRATTAERQPGSAFKLFVYLAALEDGLEPDDIVIDEPVTFGNWSPRNSDGQFRGEMTVREAFARSVNTVAVQLAARVGFDTVADMARRFGITTKIDTQPAMALGTSNVTLLELTTAYASVARGGVAARPYGITKVTTSRGRVLYTREAEEPRMLVAPWVAAKTTDLMKSVVDGGTGRGAAIGREIAGKTGTTSSNKDGWFLGFTGDLVAGVWMGRDDARRVPGLAGGRAPTQAFATFMRAATKGMPPQALNTDVLMGGFGTEPDAEVYGLGGEIEVLPAETPADAQPRLDEGFLDDVLGPEQPVGQQ